MAELQIDIRLAGALTVVELAGDLDPSGAARLMAVLIPLAATGSRVVVCDLSGLAVPHPAHLLRVFPAVQGRAGPWPHSAVHLVAPGRDMEHRLRQLRMPRFLPVHDTLGQALAAAQTDVSVIRTDLVLVPEPGSSHAARNALTGLWPEVRAEADVRQDGLVVVSELATNATRYGREPFTVSMALSRRRFLVGVTDDSRREPVLRPAEATDLGGRGMQLVAALSQEWGVRLVHDRGKTVWAAFDRQRDTDGSAPVPCRG